MAAPTTFAGYKQWIGIAKEVTPGTPVTPAYNLLADKIEASDKVTMIEDKGLRASMAEVFGEIQGVIQSDLTLSGLVHTDTIGYLIGNILGDLTVTGTTTPYSNAFSLLNSGNGQPTTHTFSWFYGPSTNGTRQYAGACLSDLSFTFDVTKSAVEYSASAMAWGSVVDGTSPTNTIGSDPALASWIGAVQIGGATNVTVLSGSVAIKRKLTPYFTAQTSVQSPYVIQRGPVGVTGSFKVIAADETQLLNYLNNSQPSLQFNFQSGTGVSQRQIQLHMNQAAYTAAKPDGSQDAIEFDINFTAVANSTDAGASGGLSPIKVTTQSSLPSGTYV